ncbi:MAG: molybdopterin-dependent oxidoreductase [Kiritimatiellia bacterium]|mgnify:CR=1 FL=1|jgi:DMSO reductase family type II enzyme molybdopterin subunit|nr:molybdopterin-dependent oxidoreductase [Pseudomonadales bacterium]MDP6473237.1 molybdopterin-dependent oxidoreductase [Pseudomonadales bacterium]MDP6829162.1 molybdopterin-dependent oxidoreductase [Pseudomonadales bacterium]MDP7024709.1 molybdopterin-dependent oxidoreductase [Kiritimatiellia bacterium]
MKVDLRTEGLEFDDGLQEVAAFDIHGVRAKPIIWDSINKITHDANCGQQLQCALNAFVWKGVVLREEQTGNYRPPNDPDCPDHNPRGCNKGLCWSHAMYSPGRIKHPYKRAGERGEGKWQRISWDQVLKEIGDKLLDVMVEHGPKTIVNGVGLEGGAASGTGATFVLASGAGTPTIPQLNTEIADDQDGAIEMFGNSSFGDSIDNWYYSDILVVWCANPSYTQITNYHYITEARYNGTEVWVINTDYSASSIPADLWVPVTPGSDAALWLGICQVLIAEGLHKEPFIKEQSDLPLLVRCDNSKYLRETDLKEDGRDYVFYMFDENSGEVVEAPYKSLLLEEVNPALEGEWQVDTLTGPVNVRPVFANFKEMLDRDYTPEQASVACGVHPDVIRTMARKFGKANGVCQASATYGVGKYYHGNLMQRAMCSAWVLCGHIGHKGTGINAMNGIITVDSVPPDGASGPSMPDLDPSMFEEWGERGFSAYRMKKEVFGLIEQEMLNSSALFYWLHAGLLELSKENNSWDPDLKRPVGEYWDEAFESGKRGVYPPPGTDPKVMLVSGGDPVRRIRSNQHLIETLFPKLEMILVSDVRWNATSRWADYVLPACGYYERSSVRAVSVFNSPFAHLTVKSSEPLYESRSDYWIGVMIVRSLAERARERGISTVTDPLTGREFKIDEIDDRATAGGRFTENDDEAVAAHTYDNGTNIDLPDWEALKKRGWAEFTGLSENMVSAQEFAGEVSPGDPWIPLTWHTDKKEPWTTLTGRIQFYIDHDWFIELGEDLTVHKESIKAGGDYPIQLIGGHARHSIHSTWSDNAIILQLQRGEPLMWMNNTDAEDRGIEDGDMVKVSNDMGDFQIQVITSAAMRPGLAAIYHHWTNLQHKNWKQYQTVMPTPFNPVEMAPVTYSEYPNLHRDIWCGEPGFNDRDTRVEVRSI